jgi:hypothetical protein
MEVFAEHDQVQIQVILRFEEPCSQSSFQCLGNVGDSNFLKPFLG